MLEIYLFYPYASLSNIPGHADQSYLFEEHHMC